MSISIDNLTIAEARALADTLSGLGPTASPAAAEHAYPVGRAVIVRTVTMMYTGRLARVTPGELVLTDAAWVADAGRWGAALSTGTLSEVEPYPDGEVVVSRACVVDCARWDHSLPRVTQ